MLASNNKYFSVKLSLSVSKNIESNIFKSFRICYTKNGSNIHLNAWQYSLHILRASLPDATWSSDCEEMVNV